MRLWLISLLCINCIIPVVFTIPDPSYSPSLQRLSTRLRSLSCPSGTYKCKFSTVCLPGSRVCDNFPNCPNGDDEEQNCDACSNDQIRCLDGTCLGVEVRCDGNRDCTQGEDELHCGCAKNKFMCVSDGSCITAEYRCNGISDCSDNSDESGCSQVVTRRERLKDALRTLLAEMESEKYYDRY